MIEYATSAGFAGMIIMTNKEGTRGKVDVFSHLRTHRPDAVITYYEDTYSVIKQCISPNTTCYHVPSPEFPVEDANKVPGVVDGNVNGYLELWEATLNADLGVARCAGPASCGHLQAGIHVNLSHLDQYLACHSYLGSEAHATEADYRKLNMLSSIDVDPDLYPNLQRWRFHINYLKSRFGNFDSRGHMISPGKSAID